MGVPGVDASVGHEFFVGVADEAESGEFPLCFCWEFVVGEEDAVVLAHASVLAFVCEVLYWLFAVGDGILSVEVGFGVEVVFFGLLTDIEFDYATFVEDILVDAVGAPLAVFLSLLPADAYDRVVGVGGVSEIVLDVGLVVGEWAAPYEGVGECVAVDVAVFFEHEVYPVEPLTVVGVADLAFVHVEGGDCGSAWSGVVVAHDVLVDAAHDESAALDEYEARASFLLVAGGIFEAAVGGVVVGPSCGGRSLAAMSAARLLAEEAAGGEQGERSQRYGCRDGHSFDVVYHS